MYNQNRTRLDSCEPHNVHKCEYNGETKCEAMVNYAFALAAHHYLSISISIYIRLLIGIAEKNTNKVFRELKPITYNDEYIKFAFT